MHLLLNTGGGDAPGLNAAIQAIVVSATRKGWKVTGCKNGYEGLVHPSSETLLPLNENIVKDISSLGGTILGTKNKGHPFNYPTAKGKPEDVSDVVVKNFKKHKFDALITIGGDGSMKLAQKFSEKGLPIIGAPKTIDFDLSKTDATIGFDTAVTIASEALERLRGTAKSHERIMILEVMGRLSGFIALHAGLSSLADVILIPEIDFNTQKIKMFLERKKKAGQKHALIIVAEGAKPQGGKLQTKPDLRLGGIGEKLADSLQKETGTEARAITLGHLQRGAPPTAYDRFLAIQLGVQAVLFAEKKLFGHMVALQSHQFTPVPFQEANLRKTVSLDSSLLQTTRHLNIFLGN